MDIKDIREKYPQYSDLSDAQLVDGLHRKFYSDMPVEDFHQKIGFTVPEAKSSVTVEAAPEATISSRLAGGIKQSIEDYKTYLQSIGASQEDLNRLAAESLDKQRAIGREVGTSRGTKEVGEAYEKSGILGAAKEVASQAPGFIASSVPQMAEAAAGAGAGAALGSVVPGIGTGIGALAGGFVALYPQFFSQNIAEQSQAMQESGVPVNISAAKAAAAGTGQALLEEAGKGYAIGKNLLTSMLGKLPTTKITKAAATEELVKAAQSTLKNVGSGVARGSIEEAFVNPAQDILQRAQAGEDLFSKEAIKGYGESMYQGALAGAAMGPATGVLETRAARKDLAEQGLDQTGKPIVTPSAAVSQPSMVVNAQGNLVPNSQANAPEQQAATPAVPLPPGSQGNLFLPEETPANSKTLTPDVLTGQTEAGKPVETEALQAPARAQSEIERNIFALEQQEQTPEVQQKISELKEQLQKGPGETLDILKQEHNTLANKGEALQAQRQELVTQRDSLKSLDEKAAVTQQINAIDAQLEAVINRQQEILKEGAQLAKQVTPAEATKEQEQIDLKGPPAIINNKVLAKFGLAPKAPIRNALRNLDMTDPADRETFIDEVNKHNIKGAKINNEAVTEYFNAFEPVQETQNAASTGAGSVSGTDERGVSVPSAGVQTPGGVTTPAPTGLGSTIGSAQQPNGGAAPSGENGNAPLTPPQTTPAPTPQPPAATTATPLAQSNDDLYQAAGGTSKPKGVSKLIGKVIDKLKAFEHAYSNNQIMSSQIFGNMQNWGSFDDGFNNLMRSAYMKLAKEGDITLKQAKLAIQRVSIFQTLFRSKLASDAIMQGNIEYDPIANMWRVVKDAVNMQGLHDQVKAFAARTGVSLDTALEQFSKAYEANRVRGWYDEMSRIRGDITRTQKRIDELNKIRLQKRTGPAEKELLLKKAALNMLKGKVERLEGLVRHMTRKQMQAGMQLYKSNPEITKGTEIWNTMRERVIKHLVDAGINTEEEARDWMDVAEYVPFQREMEVEEAKGLGIARRGIREKMSQPGIKGSMLEVANTIENMENWMRWSLSRAVSNKQLQVMLQAYKTALPDEVREGKGNTTNTFSVYEDGKQKFYNVANPAAAQAFTGVDSVVFPSMGASSKFRRAFTHAYTRIPVVPVAQLVLKDTWEAMVTSGLKHPFMLMAQIPKEIIHTMLGTSEARKILQESGTLSTHEYRGLSDADEVTERLHLSDPSNLKKVTNMLDKWSALNDNMLRQAIFAQAKREGKSDAEATMMATEIFNFRRMSGSPTIQWMNNHIPFMNAFAQMQRVTLKTLSGSGITPQTRAEGIKTLATTTGTLAMLSFMYAAAVSDDDDYKKMNRLQRDWSFVIPGTGGMRIPIRAGIVGIPKILGEYLYHKLAGSNYVDPQMFKSAMAHAVTQQVMPPMGGLAVPAISLATNHDFVYNREIVNSTQRKLSPELQMNKNTTEISKELGERVGISPLKLDFFFRSYLGSYFSLMALANNSMAESRGVPRPTSAHPVKETIQAIPGMSNFMSKDDASGAVSDFYEAAQDVDTIVNSYRALAPVDQAKATKKLEEGRDRLFYTKGIEMALGRLNTAESRILAMPASQMSADQKAAELKRIDDKRKELAEPIRKIRQQIYK